MKLNIVELSQADDYKKAVLKSLGDLSKFDVLGSSVLVATYVRPEKTKGGILMPDRMKDEDRYQGKVGLVIKKGSAAFKYDGPYPFEGEAPEIGDYVMFHSSDAREVGIRGVSCKLIDSSLIKMVVPRPEDLY